jgi:hypothetical protein
LGPAPLALAGYSLKRYTQAEILGGSMLAAWKFSNESVACDYFLPAMADACATCEDSLQHCANELVEYYHVCFPDAAKMIPQPIEPGTEGPVQLVAFTDRLGQFTDGFVPLVAHIVAERPYTLSFFDHFVAFVECQIASLLGVVDLFAQLCVE